jgi:ArsR family transcriptional regulator
MKELVKALKALSDETRLKIFRIILDNPDICVCDIMGTLKMSQTRISRNLATLKNAGLVDARRDGQWIHYSAVRGNAYCADLVKAVRNGVAPIAACVLCGRGKAGVDKNEKD